MTHYRLYILDHRGKIARALDLDCRDDEHALEFVLAHRKSHDVELWEGTRFVGAFRKSDDQA